MACRLRVYTVGFLVMCRLFGMIASGPTAARFWLLNAPDSVLDQSYKNPDGTGLAYYQGRLARVEKQPIAAYEDQEFASGARRVRSHLFVAHVRNATQGEPSLENTQPFVNEGLIFAHNGNIEGLEDPPVPLGPLYGETDSERYFALLRYHIREARDVLAGIRTAVAWILDNCKYTSLNFLLADEKHLYALRYPDFEDLYVRKLDAGEDLRGTSSYGTRAETSDHQGTILFASEKLDAASSWEELEPGTLAVAQHDLLQLKLHHL